MSQAADESHTCSLYVGEIDVSGEHPLPSQRIAQRCKPGDILILIVRYGDEFLLGGGNYCDFSASIVLIDDPKQQVKKMVCRIADKMRKERNPSP
jgi:hypothetical protein